MNSKEYQELKQAINEIKESLKFLEEIKAVLKYIKSIEPTPNNFYINPSPAGTSERPIYSTEAGNSQFKCECTPMRDGFLKEDPLEVIKARQELNKKIEALGANFNFAQFLKDRTESNCE